MNNDTKRVPRPRYGLIALAAKELGIHANTAYQRFKRRDPDLLLKIAELEMRRRKQQADALRRYADIVEGGVS